MKNIETALQVLNDEIDVINLQKNLTFELYSQNGVRL